MPYPNDTHWCGAKPGEPHKDWDDVALCYISGQQLITCDEYWLYDDNGQEYHNPEHECHPSIWDGDYPGVKQAEKYGLYHMHLREWKPDIEAIHQYGEWNIETQQHEISEEVLKKIKEKNA